MLELKGDSHAQYPSHMIYHNSINLISLLKKRCAYYYYIFTQGNIAKI